MISILRIILLCSFLHIYSFTNCQQPSGTKNSYVVTFNPVYSSGLVELGYVDFEDTYIIISDKPLNFDSVMTVLSKKKYSTMLDILDTLKMKYKVFNVVKSDSYTQEAVRINSSLKDCSNYKVGHVLFFSEDVRKSSSLVGFLIRRNTFFKTSLNFKVLSEDCVNFPNRCRAAITSCP